MQTEKVIKTNGLGFRSLQLFRSKTEVHVCPSCGSEIRGTVTKYVVKYPQTNCGYYIEAALGITRILLILGISAFVGLLIGGFGAAIILGLIRIQVFLVLVGFVVILSLLLKGSEFVLRPFVKLLADYIVTVKHKYCVPVKYE